MSDKRVRLVQTEHGYWRADIDITPAELEAFYNAQYFMPGTDQPGNMYATIYSADELACKSADCELTEAATGLPPGRFLEVGPGEGFFMAHFARRGWTVRGIDFTDQGIRHYHPELLDRLVLGDLLTLLEAEPAASYDLIICNGVLEHVIDPSHLLRLLGRVVAPGGVLRVAVPNDNSWLQRMAVAMGRIEDEFWVCPPEHLSYFTPESLDRLMASEGWKIFDQVAGFPIELYLLHGGSCYAGDPAKGRESHLARVAFDSGLYRQGLDKVLAFRRGCAAAGIGRELIVFARRDG
ncbi:MAG: class I SAM-dependent methyltransferase [Actinomycetota bacterium]